MSCHYSAIGGKKVPFMCLAAENVPSPSRSASKAMYLPQSGQTRRRQGPMRLALRCIYVRTHTGTVPSVLRIGAELSARNQQSVNPAGKRLAPCHQSLQVLYV